MTLALWTHVAVLDVWMYVTHLASFMIQVDEQLFEIQEAKSNSLTM